jgi:hypothetical protein
MNEVDLDSFILIMMEDKMKRRVSEVDLDSFILIMMEDKKMKRRVRRSQGGFDSKESNHMRITLRERTKD